MRSKQILTAEGYDHPVGMLHRQQKTGFQSVAPVYEVTVLLPIFTKKMFRTKGEALAFIEAEGMKVQG